jgi:hypothetical protein
MHVHGHVDRSNKISYIETKQPIKMIQLKYWNAFRWKRWGQEREGRGETYDYPR